MSDYTRLQPDGKPLPLQAKAALLPLTNPLSWYISVVPPGGMSLAQYQDACLRAMATWTQYILLDYYPAPAGSTRSNLWFYTMDLGYGIGAQAALGPNRGDQWLGVALNSIIAWGPDLGLDRTLCHEIGHTIGLEHSPDPSSIMYPSGNASGKPSPADIAAVQAIYGPRIVPPPPPPPVQHQVGVSWTGPATLAVDGVQKYP